VPKKNKVLFTDKEVKASLAVDLPGRGEIERRAAKS
jgi:hypothetical protein